MTLHRLSPQQSIAIRDRIGGRPKIAPFHVKDS